MNTNKVYVIDNENSPEYRKIQNVEYISKADIEKNGNPDLHFHRIVHTAQIYSREINAVNEKEMFQVNVSLGRSLAQLAIKQNSSFYSFSSKFQFMSVKSTYANQKKLFDEEILMMKESKLNWIRIFLGDTYGPNDNRDKIVNQIFKSIKNGQSLKISNPNRVIRLAFIEDIKSSLCSVIYPGNYSYVSSNVVSLGELVSQCEVIAEKKSDISWESRSKKIKQEDEFTIIQDNVNLDGYLQNETQLSIGLQKVWKQIVSN
jgi:nucleoside-diphosphate-sugar epimerase